MALAPIKTETHEEQDPIVRDFASFSAEDEEGDIPVYQPTVTIQTFDIPDEPKPIALQPPEPVAVDEPVDEPIVVRPMSILNLSEPMVIARSRAIETDPEPNDSGPRSILFDERVDVASTPTPIDVVEMPAPIDVVHIPEPVEVAQAPEPLLASDPLEAVTPTASEKAPAAIPHAASPSIDTSAAPSATQPRPGTAPITSFETALAAIRAAWATPSPDGTAPAKPPARPPQVEVDLTGDIDALDDVNRSTPATDDRPTSARHTAPRSPQTRTANGRAVQDEWGMFDPNQCGFSALVDKLDEVADPQDHPERSTKVRVISVG
jgi:hypothetical protein